MQTKNQSKPKITKKTATITIVTLALLTALGVVCSFPFPYGLTFRIGDSLKFSLGFIVVALAARKYGITAAGTVALLCDLIQTLMSGYGIPNPFISLSALITGLIFGFFLHKNVSFVKVLSAVVSSQIICSLGITSAALIIQYSFPVFPFIWWRLLQTGIMIVLQILVLYPLLVKTDILKRIKFLSD